ncbi:MAG: glycosyltransferase [Deltaproteobacteria bacterium]|nr:glycosyltransferase [Deltaproteobacteria bacterium]
MTNTNISVDFVIPTLNEEVNLQLLLASIAEQELNEHVKISKIIVVDNGSQDRTLEIAGNYGATTFSKPGFSIAALRNYGAKTATADIIIFSDADIILNKDVVKNIVLLLRSEHLSALGPDGYMPYGTATWIQKIWYYHLTTPSKQTHTTEVYNLSSGLFAIKSKIFTEIGGFNSALSIGEDSEISRRLIKNGHILVKSNKIIVYTTGYANCIKNFVQREMWHGDSFKHLAVHRNIDLLTIYILTNSLMWVSLIVVFLYTKSLEYLAINAAFIIIVPLYKALIKTKTINIAYVQLAFVYVLYSLSRSIALFKVSKSNYL